MHKLCYLKVNDKNRATGFVFLRQRQKLLYSSNIIFLNRFTGSIKFIWLCVCASQNEFNSRTKLPDDKQNISAFCSTWYFWCKPVRNAFGCVPASAAQQPPGIWKVVPFPLKELGSGLPKDSLQNFRLLGAYFELKILFIAEASTLLISLRYKVRPFSVELTKLNQCQGMASNITRYVCESAFSFMWISGDRKVCEFLICRNGW